MSMVINVYVFKINSIASNASVTIGESVINSPHASSKLTGTNCSYGDDAPPIATMKNIYVDPDVNDGTEIASADTSNTIQS